MPSATIINARYVIPVRPHGVVLENQSVVIRDDLIEGCFPREQARSRYPDAREVDLPQHALLPGLINMHTHSPMTLLRGYADDLPLQEWLDEHIWPVEKRFVGEEFVADGTRLALVEMIRAGTTCFSDMYFFPEVTATVVKESGMRACIGLPVIELPTAWASDIDEYLEKGLGVFDRWQGESLISFALAPHAPYSVSDVSLAKIAQLSDEFQLPVHMHILETDWEVRQSRQVHDLAPLPRLDGLGLLTKRLLAVHMTQLLSGDIALLQDRNVNVIHCPQSSLKLANGICPVSKLSAAGINIAIGTDGAASNNNLDLLSEVQTASLLAKGMSGDARAVDAFTALEMITINGARALGQEDRIGTIEAGKLADLAALDLSAPETQPEHNIVSLLIYAASSRQFSDVWVAGQRLLQGGKLTTIDLPGVIAAARRWRSKMPVNGS